MPTKISIIKYCEFPLWLVPISYSIWSSQYDGIQRLIIHWCWLVFWFSIADKKRENRSVFLRKFLVNYKCGWNVASFFFWLLIAYLIWASSLNDPNRTLSPFPLPISWPAKPFQWKIIPFFLLKVSQYQKLRLFENFLMTLSFWQFILRLFCSLER